MSISRAASSQTPSPAVCLPSILLFKPEGSFLLGSEAGQKPRSPSTVNQHSSARAGTGLPMCAKERQGSKVRFLDPPVV